MYIEYNANPEHKRVGDCVIRAVSKALNQSWDKTYVDLMVEGIMLCDLPSANNVWGSYLRSKGFERVSPPENCPDCYTVKQFCKDYPKGNYVMAINGHAVAVIDGNYYDTWDSGDEIPLYVWRKKES